MKLDYVDCWNKPLCFIGMKKNVLLIALSLILGVLAACQKSPATSAPANANVAVTPETAPRPQAAANTRQMAWDLGSSLGLAALGQARQAPADSVAAMQQQAEFLAQGAGLQIPALPTKTNDTTQDSAATLNYLLQGPGGELATQIADKFGDDHAALYAAAVRANILVLLYAPQGELNQAAATGLTKAAKDAKLPTEYWQPVLDKVKTNASEDDVSQAVAKMEEDVSDYLAGHLGK